jgi:hypothetical protein
VVGVLDHISRGPGFDSRQYKIFLEIVVVKRGPFVMIIEEIFGRNSSGSGLENRDNGHKDPLS